jgi:hypothetical protein
LHKDEKGGEHIYEGRWETIRILPDRSSPHFASSLYGARSYILPGALSTEMAYLMLAFTRATGRMFALRTIKITESQTK